MYVEQRSLLLRYWSSMRQSQLVYCSRLDSSGFPAEKSQVVLDQDFWAVNFRSFVKIRCKDFFDTASAADHFHTRITLYRSSDFVNCFLRFVDLGRLAGFWCRLEIPDPRPNHTITDLGHTTRTQHEINGERQCKNRHFCNHFFTQNARINLKSYVFMVHPVHLHEFKQSTGNISYLKRKNKFFY